MGIAEVGGVGHHNSWVAVIPERSMVRTPGIGENFAVSGHNQRNHRQVDSPSLHRTDEGVYQRPGMFVADHGDKISGCRYGERQLCRGSLHDSITGIGNRFEDDYPCDIPAGFPGKPGQSLAAAEPRVMLSLPLIFFQRNSDKLNGPIKVCLPQQFGQFKQHGNSAGVVIGAGRGGNRIVMRDYTDPFMRQCSSGAGGDNIPEGGTLFLKAVLGYVIAHVAKRL